MPQLVQLENDGDPTADSEIEGAPDGDAREDVPLASEAGPVTLVVSSMEVLDERLCDLDGDGSDDSAVADLGSPNAALVAAAMTTLDTAVNADGGIGAHRHDGVAQVAPGTAFSQRPFDEALETGEIGRRRRHVATHFLGCQHREKRRRVGHAQVAQCDLGIRQLREAGTPVD